VSGAQSGTAPGNAPTSAGPFSGVGRPIASRRVLAIVIAAVFFILCLVAAFAIKHSGPRAAEKEAGATGGSQVVQEPGQASSGPSMVQDPARAQEDPKLLQEPAKAQESPSMLQEPAAQPVTPDMVQQPAAAPPSSGMLQAPAAAPNGPPQEIVDYLKFVGTVWSREQALVNDQMSSFLREATSMQSLKAEHDTLPTDPDEAANAQNNYKGSYKSATNRAARSGADSVNDWDNLAKTFRTRTPPPECLALHDHFYRQLGLVQASMAQWQSIMGGLTTGSEGVNGDALSGINQLESQSRSIDSAMAEADADVSVICAKYRLTKEYTIKDPASSSALGGLAGLTGGPR